MARSARPLDTTLAPQMSTRYAGIAGRSLERLAALSDGIFAVAMTLLVLDLRVPVVEASRGQRPLWAAGASSAERALWEALVRLSPRLLTYGLSFLTLGIFWLGQQTQLHYSARSDRGLAWRHLAFLFAVALMPFSTSMLAEFITYRLALVAYWLNLVVLGLTLLVAWRYAARTGLLTEEATPDVRAAVERRIVVYQALYAGCVLVGGVNTYASIALLVVLQLNSAAAPRLKWFDRF